MVISTENEDRGTEANSEERGVRSSGVVRGDDSGLELVDDLLGDTSSISMSRSVMTVSTGQSGMEGHSYDETALSPSSLKKTSRNDPIIRHLRNSDRALPQKPSTSTRSSSKSVMEGLSINKLKFDQVHLHGRDDETKTLRSIWDRMCLYHYERNEELGKVTKQSSEESGNLTVDGGGKCKNLVVIDGISGVGKSRLVTSALESAVRAKDSFFVTGKFDLNNTHVPFDGIVMAINDICDQILANFIRSTSNQSQLATSDRGINCKSGSNDSTNTPSSPASSSTHHGQIMKTTVEFADVKKLLLTELQQELPFLITIFPRLSVIVGDLFVDDLGSVLGGSVNAQNVDDEQIIGASQADSAKANGDRIKHCVRKLIKVICSYRPLVIFCDDVQWADNESLDLLHQILTDETNHDALMVIVAFRSDEVFGGDIQGNRDEISYDSHPVLSFLNKIEELKETSYAIPSHHLTIGNLSLDDLDAFLLDLLSSDTTATSQKLTSDLAVVIHEKTNGNMFFVVQLLQTLVENGLISFNLGLMKWIWDVQEVRENSPAADNVVELLKDKLREDTTARQLLPIAACIGSTFEVSTIAMVADGLRRSIDAEDSEHTEVHVLFASFLSREYDIESKLNDCYNEGYLQSCDSTGMLNKYQFVHDRVQEAALKAVPENLLRKLKNAIGRILVAELPEEKMASMAFTILGLLDDESNNPSNEERLALLKLNMLAGKKAMSYAAFKTGTKHFERAISLLSSDAWETHDAETFDAYLSAAESEYCIGNFDKMNKYCDVMLTRSNIREIDKLRVSNIMMDGFMADNKSKQAVAFAVSALRKSGCKFPKGSVRIGFASAAGLLRTKFSKKMQDPAYIADLPFSSDPAIATVMETLDKLASSSFIAGDTDLFPLVILKSIQWTFDHGINKYSPPAFALMALLITNFLDDFGAGWNYAKNALIMLKRLKCQEIESRTIFLAYVYCAHWSKPMQDCLKPLMKAYRVGLSSGDVLTAMHSCLFYCEIEIWCGKSLELVDENCVKFGRQMQEYGQLNTLTCQKMYHQMVRILLGRAGDNNGKGAILSGDVMSQDTVLQHLEDTNDQIMIAAIHRYRLILASYMGEYETGALLSIEWAEKAIKLLPGQPTNLMIRFCGALCCYAHYRASRNKRYLKEGRKHHKILKRWSERSKAHNPNSVHREVLLSAELDAATGKHRSAYTKFESAVLMAGRRGIVQDQALANERFAAYCSERSDAEEATYRLNSAIALYTEWRAAAKVSSLMELSSNTNRRLSTKSPPIIGSTVQVIEASSQLSGHAEPYSRSR